MAVKICRECGKGFEPSRSDAVYCSQKCRLRAHRKKKAAKKRVVLEPGRAVEPVRAESYDDVAEAVDDARRASNRFGQLAVTAPRPVRPGCARIGDAIAEAIEREGW